jgi:hypothetical protein
VLVYAVVGDSLSPTSPLATRSTFSSDARMRSASSRVRGDEPEPAKPLRTQERKLQQRFGRDPERAAEH